MKRRTTKEKLSLFKGLFAGRGDAHGTYDPRSGRTWQVKAPVNDRLFLDHLTGRRPLGLYPMSEDTIRFAVVDFDILDERLVSGFLTLAWRNGFPAYVERSKSKGYHCWFFFEPPGVLAKDVRPILRSLLAEIGAANTEVFPKQDRIDDQTAFGNFINLPLFGRLVPEARTVFVNTDFVPFADQWELLYSVRKILSSAIKTWLSQNSQKLPGSTGPIREPATDYVPVFSAFGLRPCAQKMLREGVRQNQRVSCFRLAVQLRKAGLPLDCALAALTVWAGKNRPVDGRRMITEREVMEQTRCAYRGRAYTSCGCEDPAIEPFCDSRCDLAKGSRSEKQQSGRSNP